MEKSEPGLFSYKAILRAAKKGTKTTKGLGIEPAPQIALGLIQRTYQGPFRLYSGEQGLFIGYNFTLDDGPGVGHPDIVTWKAVFGAYGPYNLYNIFELNRNVCWQDNLDDPHRVLRYWNQDGLAHGGPQDWELFQFIDAGFANGLVKIKNLYYPGGNFVRYSGNGFSADAGAASAAVFMVVS